MPFYFSLLTRKWIFRNFNGKSSNQGVRVSEVLENGAAQTHQLLQNDVILSIDGTDVNTAKELKDQITSHNWGETINILL